MRKWRGWNHQRENPVKLTPVSLPLLSSLLPFLLCKQNTHWNQRNPTPKDPTQRIYIENFKKKNQLSVTLSPVSFPCHSTLPKPPPPFSATIHELQQATTENTFCLSIKKTSTSLHNPLLFVTFNPFHSHKTSTKLSSVSRFSTGSPTKPNITRSRKRLQVPGGHWILQANPHLRHCPGLSTECEH